MTGQLLWALAESHEVAALYLRAADEPRDDRALGDRLALAVEVRRDPRVQGPGRVRRSARRASGLMAGRPLWATDWAVPAFAARVRDVARTWRPDVVQAELHVMGQYLPGSGEPSRPPFWSSTNRATAAAADLVAWERGPRRVGRRARRRRLAPVRARVPGERRRRRRLHRARTARSSPTLAPEARLLPSRPGSPFPSTAGDPVGAEPPTVLFVGSFVPSAERRRGRSARA